MIVAGCDASAWALGITVGCWARYDGHLDRVLAPGLVTIILFAVVAQLAVGTAAGLYRRRHTIGGVEDAIDLARVMAIVGVLVFLVDLLPATHWVPRLVPLTATVITLALAVTVRLLARAHRERRIRPSPASAEPVIIFGAGAAGLQLVRQMLTDPSSGYLPVALLDDDPEVGQLRIAGVPVRGTRRDIESVARDTEATLLIIAVPSADLAVVREVGRMATESGLGVKVLPPLNELFRPWVGLSDLRDLDIADLLGRRQIDTDITSIAGYLAGRRVLVTGAGGSIGAELCRQIHAFGPAELLMLDRDESALHAVQLSIYGRAMLDSPDVILADIRDHTVVREVFDERRPEVVFHAAALKHLPMLEQYPMEAWKTNVLGTLHVLDAARRCGAEKFVNISTDKAANPTSVLGRSKRLGERLTADAAAERAGTYLSVRFGNVLGSRGSVLSTFAEQLSGGGPITVTHPDVTRFFMTVPEAVQLVIQAAAIGRPGEALVLDVGAPVRIIDVARQVMALAGRAAPIVYTGLRGGEKLHEELFGHGEQDYRPFHPAISHVRVPPLASDRMQALAAELGPVEAMATLAGAAPLPVRPVEIPRNGRHCVSARSDGVGSDDVGKALEWDLSAPLLSSQLAAEER